MRVGMPEEGKWDLGFQAGVGWAGNSPVAIAAGAWRQGVSEEPAELQSGGQGCLASQTQPKGFAVTPTDGTAVDLEGER